MKLLLLLGTALVFIICDSLSAKWGKTDDKLALAIMIVLSPLGYICFGILNRSIALSVISGLVNVLLLIGTVLVGVFYFNDQINLRQLIGLICAFIAVILLAPR